MFRNVVRTIMWGFTTFLVMSILATSTAHTATLRIVDGQLIGASGVDVVGRLYNVEFLDGTCIEVFSGCDSPSDFVFRNNAAGTWAAQALLDQVFLDSGGLGLFDTDPTLTVGCDDPMSCNPFIPFGLGTTTVGSSVAFNSNTVTEDYTTPNAFVSTSLDLSRFRYTTWARFSPIPEPGTGIMMGLGLVGLGARRRDG